MTNLDLANDYTLEYKLIHLLGGGIIAVESIPCYYRKQLFIMIICYQLLQLFGNFRFFIFQKKIVKGNSIDHTINKLRDYFIGYLLVWILYRFV
jgi:hypothetical protein